jgi:hypothetical protein
MATIEAIETVYLEADASSVTFSSLGSYEHLQLQMSVRTDYTSTRDMVRINFNSDTGTNYHRHYMRGYGSSGTPQGNAYTGVAFVYGGWIPGAKIDASEYGPIIVDILDYRNASKNTTLTWLIGSVTDAEVYFTSGMWDSTAAVTSIAMTSWLGADFVRGSEFTLYGLKSS